MVGEKLTGMMTVRANQDVTVSLSGVGVWRSRWGGAGDPRVRCA